MGRSSPTVPCSASPLSAHQGCAGPSPRPAAPAATATSPGCARTNGETWPITSAARQDGSRTRTIGSPDPPGNAAGTRVSSAPARSACSTPHAAPSAPARHPHRRAGPAAARLRPCTHHGTAIPRLGARGFVRSPLRRVRRVRGSGWCRRGGRRGRGGDGGRGEGWSDRGSGRCRGSGTRRVRSGRGGWR